MNMEVVPCPLCKADDFTIFLVRRDLNTSLPGDFRLVRCNVCGLVYLNPRPTQESFSSLYPDNYDQYIEPAQHSSSGVTQFGRTYGLRKRVLAVTQHREAGKLLDIGCAKGEFLLAMRDLTRWDVFGVEPSLGASEYARTQAGLNVQTGALEQANYPDGFFDVITMWNVIEHLPDPLSTLKFIHRLLKPKGLLVFNTPSLDSWDARLFGPYWIGFELPRHYVVFSRKTLRDMLQTAGFGILNTRSIYGSHAASMSSMRFWLRSLPMPDNLRGLIEKILFSLLCRVLMAPVFFLMDRFNLSTAPTDFCEKNGKTE